jgi:hypothetical protein
VRESEGESERASERERESETREREIEREGGEGGPVPGTALTKQPVVYKATHALTWPHDASFHLRITDKRDRVLLALVTMSIKSTRMAQFYKTQRGQEPSILCYYKCMASSGINPRVKINAKEMLADHSMTAPTINQSPSTPFVVQSHRRPVHTPGRRFKKAPPRPSINQDSGTV